MAKKRKFRVIKIKLSAKQYRSLMNYSKARSTTPNKLIKKSINRFTIGFDKMVPEKYYVQEEQLSLFAELQEDNKEEKNGE